MVGVGDLDLNDGGIANAFIVVVVVVDSSVVPIESIVIIGTFFQVARADTEIEDIPIFPFQ